MGRPGQPNEVAPCFLFLACEDSSYMTGQVLHPDGDCVQLSKWPEMAATGIACVRFRTQIATGSWRDTPFKGGKCC